jgi:FKBP-type peptidyl-prolyl cis-trans isomerase FklB
MMLRWSFAAVAVLAVGSAFAQSGTSASSTAAAPATAGQQQQAPPPAPLTPADKPNLSYAIGFQIGNDLIERKLDVDINTVIRALQDGYAKRKATVADDTMRDVLTRMQYEMYNKAKGDFEKLASDNKAKSQKFLSENRSKKGIVTLPSGLQYQIIEEGTGAKHPTPESNVTVHFRGSLASGLEFDSSFARGQPAQFKVNEVIKAWQEILPLMKVGDYWRVFTPPDMAYGERGQPPRIGPNEALVFELKLVDIK